MKKILRSTIGKSLLACSFFSVTLFSSSDVMAQSGVGINGTGAPANSSAGLDVDFSNKGVLIPRIALTSTTDVTTIPTPANSLLVFNTTNGAGLTPGFYYYDGNLMQWTAVAGSGGGGGGGGTTIACSSPSEDMTVVYNNGQWECNDVLEVDPTWNAVSVNSFSGPSSSYNFLVDGDSYITDQLGVGAAPSTSYDLRVGDNVGIGSSPSSSYNLSVSGDAHVSSNLRVGTTSTPPTNGIITGGGITCGGSLDIGSVSSQTISSSWYALMVGSSGGIVRRSSVAINNTGISSKLFKTNIKELSFDKEKFLSLKPYAYDYKKNFGGNSSIGLIAEEVELVMPQLVHYGPKRILDENGEVKFDAEGNEMLDESQTQADGVYYEKIGVYLLPIVAEQEATIKSQQAEIAELKARLDKQEAMITRLVEAIPASKGSNVLPDNTLKAEVEKSRK